MPDGPLAGAQLVAFLGTTRPAEAKRFFAETLGLPLVSEDAFALVDGEWVWKRRFIRVDLAGDLSHHLKAAATPFTG